MAYAVDLFCGAGGMSEGLIQAGFHILFSSDISSDVQKTYVHRHEQLGFIQGKNTYFLQSDIKDISGKLIWQHINALEMFRNNTAVLPEKIDAVFGGPPCQGFSRAGRRKVDDPRNLLFKEYLRVINELHPRYVVMENVEGFNDTKFYGFVGVTGKRYKDGSTAPQILLDEFRHIGYDVLPPQVVDASDFGVPQRRRRAIFIAYLKGEQSPKYPEPTVTDENRVTVKEAIGDLIQNRRALLKHNPNLTSYQLISRQGRTPNVDGFTIPQNREHLNNELSRHQPQIVERFSLFKEGEDGNAVRKRIFEKGISLRTKRHLLAQCSKQLNMTEEQLLEDFKKGNVTDDVLNKLLTKKTIRTKLYKDKPSLTVVTLPDDYISPFENRIFSVREMARLQSFDDSFEFLSKRTTGGARRRIEVPQYTQVGNAVPPLLAKAIASEILKAINASTIDQLRHMAI